MTDKAKNAGAGKAPPENTDAWIPDDVGDSLQGEVVDVDSAWSDWRAGQSPNDPDAGWYPLLTVREDGSGTVYKLHGFRTVLFNELVKREPIPGERIIVTYLGAGEAKNGKNPPEVYRVTVPGRPPEQARRVYAGMRRGRVAPGSGHEPEPATTADAGVREPEPPSLDERFGDTIPT